MIASKQGEADGERDEHEVEDGRDPELPARKSSVIAHDETFRATPGVRAEGPVARVVDVGLAALVTWARIP